MMIGTIPMQYDDEFDDGIDVDDNVADQTCIRQSHAKKSQHWQRAKQCACIRMNGIFRKYYNIFGINHNILLINITIHMEYVV